ncbi:MAG: Mini-ribonuclease 3 [Bacillota bacterium]
MNMDFLQVLGVPRKSEEEIQFTSPLVYAYLGDAIYEVYVRTYITCRYGGSVNDLHKIATRFVKASAQARIVRGLENELSTEEWNLLKRGRNQKSGSVPKNANISDYKYATGFEALIGYLYLMGQSERMEQIILRAIDIIEKSEE